MARLVLSPPCSSMRPQETPTSIDFPLPETPCAPMFPQPLPHLPPLPFAQPLTRNATTRKHKPEHTDEEPPETHRSGTEFFLTAAEGVRRGQVHRHADSTHAHTHTRECRVIVMFVILLHSNVHVNTDRDIHGRALTGNCHCPSSYSAAPGS